MPVFRKSAKIQRGIYVHFPFSDSLECFHRRPSWLLGGGNFFENIARGRVLQQNRSHLLENKLHHPRNHVIVVTENGDITHSAILSKVPASFHREVSGAGKERPIIEAETVRILSTSAANACTKDTLECDDD